MISYLLFSKNSKINNSFNIKDIPGTTKRIDVVLRAILSIINSNYLDQINPKIILNLDSDIEEIKTIFIENINKIPFINDEFKAVRFFSNILSKSESFTKRYESFNLRITNNTFEEIIDDLIKNNKIYYLNINGIKIEDINFNNKNMVFILGDHKGLPEEKEKYLIKNNVDSLSLGPIEYLTSHCIMLLQYWINKRKHNYFSNKK